MKVIVFGATGTVGRLAVETLLKSGHTVTAFARSPQKLKWGRALFSAVQRKTSW